MADNMEIKNGISPEGKRIPDNKTDINSAESENSVKSVKDTAAENMHGKAEQNKGSNENTEGNADRKSDEKKYEKTKGTGKENTKKLITETITGRKMTPDRILRTVCSAALFGAVFGLAASLFFCGVNAVGKMASERAENAKMQSSANDTEEILGEDGQDSDGMKGESEGISSDGSGAAGGNSGADNAAGENKNSGGTAYGGSGTGNESHDGSSPGEEEGQYAGSRDNNGQTVSGQTGGTGADNRGDDKTHGENNQTKPDYMSAYENLTALRAKIIDETSKYIVSISATSTGTTWFDNVASSTKNYSGIILSVGNDEILILSTAEAAESESLRVSFDNSVTVDAYVKQRSMADNLAVLAVSAKNGIEESMLEDMTGIELAGVRNVKSGEPVIAVGAPLGVNGSYSFGDIGYINNKESGYDVEQCVFYSDMDANAETGSFVIDCEGRLIGVVSADKGSSVSTEDGQSISRIISASSLLGTVNYLKQGRQIPYAGIKGSEVSFDMRYSGIPEGIYVTDIAHDSAAYRAGIMRGDIISEIDGEPVENMDGLSKIIRKKKVGDEIKVSAKRSASNGNYTDIKLTLNLGER